MKKHLSTIILILIFLVGLSLVLYPTVADYWNSLHQSRAIATYAEEVAHIDTENTLRCGRTPWPITKACGRGTTFSCCLTSKKPSMTNC